MANVKIVLNEEGVKNLLRSDEMLAICKEHANKAVERLGDGYEVQERHYPERNGVVILPTTHQTRKDNLKNDSILKALR